MIPLLILGLLKQNPGSHGYELLALMEERHYKYIVNFTKGSFYYNLQQLEDKQCIVKVDPSSKSSRETNNYVITETGEREFEQLMVKVGAKTDYVNLSFYAALLFANEYNREELTKLIEIQIEQSKQKISLLEQSIEHNEALPVHFKKMLENSRAHHLVNVKWFEELLQEKLS
ncbi:PadR family transcriptional regulator [Paenibacillus sp. NFR01]|uniref:PadR family transcriptional regulator n=1 Tax=Paenibacillus sp. NFR01 TaxID=1566279 RepID=UPI0008BD2519|nr:helix-turn-helix transcriptional regulator [Paenibacillus sp. NFR01]SEU27776.1 transcriptional regulator, PadR family [Paenibacillus sp. NFR01]